MAYQRRRYKIGEQPIYDRAFDILISTRLISNPHKSTNIYDSWVYYKLQDREGIEYLLYLWKGDDQGYYYKNGEKLPSDLKAAEDDLQEVHNEFKRMQQRWINWGRKPPTEMPEDMMERKLKAEAKVDVIKDEIRKLEKALNAFKEKEAKIRKGQVLKYGPKGSGSQRNGILAEIDGQVVKPDKEGVLRIADELSPYNGLEVWRYREEVGTPWAKEKRRREELNLAELKKAKKVYGYEPKILPPVPLPKYNKEKDEISYPWKTE